MELLKNSTNIDKYFHLRPGFIAHRNELTRDDKKWQEITIMEGKGRAMIRIYQYDYYEENEYSIADLKVEPSYRGNGLGRAILSIAEDIVEMMGGHSVSLFVNKDSWMVHWYERRGYVQFLSDYETTDGDIWMIKTIYLTAQRDRAITHAFLNLANPQRFIREMSVYDDTISWHENLVRFINKMRAENRLEELWQRMMDHER